MPEITDNSLGGDVVKVDISLAQYYYIVTFYTAYIYYPRRLCRSAWVGCLSPSVSLSVCLSGA